MPAISLLALERISTGSLTKHFFNGTPGTAFATGDYGPGSCNHLAAAATSRLQASFFCHTVTVVLTVPALAWEKSKQC
jgi:hypothetical protein